LFGRKTEIRKYTGSADWS